jgi:phage tail-like protein
MTFKHGMDRVVRKAMGRTVFNEVVLERIYSGRDEFSVWRDQIVLGVEDRRMVKIEYLAPDGRTVIREYDLYNAWPKRWELPPMDAGSSTPAVEKITLSVERVVMAAGTGERTVAEQTQV